MHDISQISQAIEQKRMKLNQAADKYGLSTSIVLKLSEELDILINIYNNRLLRIHRGLEAKLKNADVS